MINILKSLGTSHFVDFTRKSKVVILPIHTFHLLSLSVKKGFVKGEASRILRANSSKTTFEEIISNFEQRLIDRGYPQTMIKKNLLSDIKFTERESALLKHNNKEEKEILPFVTQYQPSVSTLKEVLMKKWNLIQNQPLLPQIFKEPPIISYKKGKSLKDMLVRAKI